MEGFYKQSTCSYNGLKICALKNDILLNQETKGKVLQDDRTASLCEDILNQAEVLVVQAAILGYHLNQGKIFL